MKTILKNVMKSLNNRDIITNHEINELVDEINLKLQNFDREDRVAILKNQLIAEINEWDFVGATMTCKQIERKIDILELEIENSFKTGM